MQPKIDKIRRALLADPAVESVGGYIGGGRGINNAWTFVRLKPLARAQGLGAATSSIGSGDRIPPVPGTRVFLFVEQDIRFGGGGGGGGNYEYMLLADDTRLLRVWGERVSRALKDVPELTGFDDELVSSQQISLAVDRSEARRLGVEMATVTQALNNAFGQRQVSTIYNALNQYRVVMEVAPELAQGPEALDRMYVIANDGQRVPLSAFSGYEHAAADDRVSHWGQFASTEISFELKPGVSLSQAQGRNRSRRRAAGDAVDDSGAHGGQRAAVRDDAGQPVARHHRHAAHRLHRPRRAVRKLHAPADDSLDAAVGGCRRAAGAAHAGHRVQPDRDAGAVPAGRAS